MRPRATSRPDHRGGQQGTGYSLVEVVVSLTVFVAILLGVLFIFSVNYRSARDRSDTAKLQETLRGAQHDLARLVRMAGSSGLPHELAIDVDDNVGPGSHIGGLGSPRVAPGTDVLTVRGVFSTPLYRVGPADGRLRLGASGVPTTGMVEIHDPSPQTGVAQSLAELVVALEAGQPRTAALLLVSQLDESIFAVVESDIETARITRDGDHVTAVTLEFETAGALSLLSGEGAAAALRGAAFVGLLEEYRFYVRRALSAPGDETSAPRMQLSVARFVPGTDQPWGDLDSGLAANLADNVSDLQVTFVVDGEGDRRVVVDLDSGTPAAADTQADRAP